MIEEYETSCGIVHNPDDMIGRTAINGAPLSKEERQEINAKFAIRTHQRYQFGEDRLGSVR
jgi:hypothetical protein